MAWEPRGHGRYYYRKHWQDGTCRSVYLGHGTTAQLLAELEAARSAEATATRRAEQERRLQVEQTSCMVAAISDQVRLLLHAVLVSNGFHQHRRQWRRSKAMNDGPQELQPGDSVTMVPVREVPDPAVIQAGLRELNAALKIEIPPTGRGKAAQETAAVLSERERRGEVRRVLAAYPMIWPVLRTRISNARDALIKHAINADPASGTGQVVEHALKGLAAELGYTDAPPLEQLLIEQVCLAWFDLDYVTMQYAGHVAGSHTLTSGSYWDRRLNGAQRRYLRAVETLARVRKLARWSPLTVHIGGQQVNVAGPDAYAALLGS